MSETQNPQTESPAGAPAQDTNRMPGSQSVPPLEPVRDPFIDKPETEHQGVTEADQTGEAATERDSPDKEDDGA